MIHRLRAFVAAQRVIVALVLAAFALRFGYDLFVHPPLDFRTSDMRTYLLRAAAMERAPWSSVDPRATFFPWGMPALLYVVRATLGKSNAAISFVLAALGAGVVGYWTATAARLLSAHRWAWIGIGVASVVHVPLVFLGGFVLSEVPFTFLLAASMFHTVRWLDERTRRDALIAGAALALAAVFRPQAGISMVLLAGVLAWQRGALPRPRAGAFALALAPIVVMSALSALRVHHHTGRWGWISTNAAFNFTFGRCHCHTLGVAPEGERYGPPALERLHDFESKHGVRPIVTLDPVLEPELVVRAQVWEQGPFWELSARCVRESGPLRQAKFAATHMLLLWGYNLPWPTGGILTEIWQIVQALAIPGLLFALARSLRRRRPDFGVREATLAAHVLALLATAALFFGEARLRVPYDGPIWILAMTVYAPWLSRRRSRSASSDLRG